jgi:hypothetical protein
MAVYSQEDGDSERIPGSKKADNLAGVTYRKPWARQYRRRT